ncbi:MAG: bifunctional diguanylate cyclase/phosphodiesterase [Devosia sp.]|uniref:putative bifunctional diguanylate cyclase/phosphodiesterase n=1 Tax=Devosia sp. TaxID=1871048 RepID=UPI002632C89E|nr:GGDEF domain-containing phosphodiesterase [Devosia sp.]MDB5530488.1 bifunctional diguanylate cyclase/phosphodiesterase [Devosia sp.]
MRKIPTLFKILEGYRRFSLLAAAAMLTATGLSVVGLLPKLLRTGEVSLVYAGIIAIMVFMLVGLRLGYRALAQGIDSADKANRAVLASVNRDALTGAFSRSYFIEQLRSHVYHGSDEALGYMQLDMDNLKVLNDSHGHNAGDAALSHLVKTINTLVPTAIVGRLGGDEFGIAIPAHDNKPALRRLGEQLLRELDRPINIGGRPVRLSATVGIALAPADASDAGDLISKADLALYKGKRAGRHTVVEFDADMLGDERHRRFVERELRAALLMDELELHYQPVFNADGKTIKSYEALVRWQHKVRGMIAPGEFIHIAEQSELIDKLGEWVLRRACIDLPALGVAVAVNVSPAQLRRAEFAKRFVAIVAETGTDPRQLIVEVTETVPMTGKGQEQENLEALRQMGVRIAIDDFGAGHASLQYLRGFAFDIIKIDRTYVSNIVGNRIDSMIVSAICDIARSLPVEVIAEGVETAEQLAVLQLAGCTGLQGFLLGRPKPLSKLIAGRALARVADAA